MNQIDQQQHGLAVHEGQTKIVQIGDQFFQLSEVQSQPLTVNHQPVNQSPLAPAPTPVPVHYQPQVQTVYPQALPPPGNEWSWQMVALLGAGLLIVTGFGTFLIVKAALPPAAAPVVVPLAPAPAPAPQPIIINQAPLAPPPPPPMPYTQQSCRPAGGLFGGEVCDTVKGWR